MERETHSKKEDTQSSAEAPGSGGGGRDKNREETEQDESSSTDTSDSSDDSELDEILIPEPGMGVWVCGVNYMYYICILDCIYTYVYRRNRYFRG